MTATDTTAGRAEAIRLARVLGTDPSALPGLAMLTPVERAAVRHVVLDSLLAEHRTLLARLADSSALVPVSLTVKIAQNVFGPRLAALVSGFLSSGRAAGLIGKVPRDLLVDQTPHLDERILPPLAAKVAASVHQDLAVALAEVDAARDEAVRRLVATLPDLGHCSCIRCDRGAVHHRALTPLPH